MFLLPILFLPVSVDAFGMGKNMLLMALTIVGLIMWLVEVLVNKKDSFKVNKAFGLLALVTVWAWVGWYQMAAGVKMRSLTDVTGVGMLTTALAWFFLWLQVTDEEEKQKQLNWLTVSGVLMMVTSVVVFLIPASKMPINWPTTNPMISITAGWSMAGSVLSEAIVLLFLVLEWGKRLMVKLKN